MSFILPKPEEKFLKTLIQGHFVAYDYYPKSYAIPDQKNMYNDVQLVEDVYQLIINHWDSDQFVKELFKIYEPTNIVSLSNLGNFADFLHTLMGNYFYKYSDSYKEYKKKMKAIDKHYEKMNA